MTSGSECVGEGWACGGRKKDGRQICGDAENWYHTVGWLVRLLRVGVEVQGIHLPKHPLVSGHPFILVLLILLVWASAFSARGFLSFPQPLVHGHDLVLQVLVQVHHVDLLVRLPPLGGAL